MKFTSLTVALLVIIGCSPSGDSARSDTQISPPVLQLHPPQTSHFQMENGLQVLAIHNPASPMVGLNLAIKVGSAYEDYSTSGMSHMLEHLLFNGTERRTQEELYEETDYYGAYSNAHTDRFYTNFMLLLPAEFIAEGMDIQADMIFNSILPAQKFTKERGIVMEEIRQGRDRESYQVNKFFDLMNYGETGIGLPTLGTISTIEHLSRDETYRFYRTHYIPNNMVLSVIGNFDTEKLKRLIESQYGGFPPQPVEQYQPAEYHFQPGAMNQTRGRASRVSGQVVLEAPPFGAPGEWSYELLASLLAESLREALTDFNLSVNYNPNPFNGRLLVGFTAEPDADVEAMLATIVDKLIEADDNLGRLITPAKLALLTKKRQVEDYSLLDQPHYYGMMRAADLVLGGASYPLDKISALARITADKVIADVKGFSTQPHHFNLFLPETEGDTARVTAGQTLERTVLPSGVVLVTSTSSGSRIFGMHILIKNRHALEDSLEGGAEILHSLLDSGTDRYSKEELQDELKAIGATLKTVDMGFIPYDDYYNLPDYGYVRFECLSGDAPQGIELVAHMLDRTVLDQEKLDKALVAARRRVSMQQSTASHTASLEFKRLLLGAGHPSVRSVSGSPQSLGKITLSNLKQLQQAYFKPENYIISISSEIPHAELVEIFNNLWREPAEPALRLKPEFPPATDVQEKLVELDKEQAQIRLGYRFRLDPADREAFDLMTRLLSYRMMFDLRETQGLAYTLSLRPASDGETAWLTASMGTGVDNIERAVSGIKSYMDAGRLDDLTDRELQKTVNAAKGRYMMRNLSRLGQAYYLGYHEYYDEDYRLALERRSAGEDVTVRDVKRVARSYLALPDNHVLVIVK